MKYTAITLGDINGIGPEIALKSVYTHRWPRDRRFVFVGDDEVLRTYADMLDVPNPPSWNPANPFPARKKAVCWNPYKKKVSLYPGKIRVDAARAAVCWIRSAVEQCLAGRFAGMVTAPICKEGLKKAGFSMPGHTEYLAECCGTSRFAMMLIGGPLRVLLVTRHLPLRRVADAVTRENVRGAIAIAAEALPWLGCSKGRIGVCGLNPHAGDGGAIGDEEQRIIRPAVMAMRRRGIPAEGPVPPDVMFYQALHGQYDVVVAMYHDQGLGPLKMLAFESGVNVTLGLPMVRTSPDHGTAFDIAGTCRADATSMSAALKLAGKLSARTNPWKK